MPASDPFPAGVDPAHVWAVATAAAPSIQQDGTVLLVGGRYPARIVMPNPLAANEAEAALKLVGYQVSRASRGTRGRDLNVTGLEHRRTRTPADGHARGARQTRRRTGCDRFCSSGTGPPSRRHAAKRGRSATAHRPGQSSAARIYLPHLRHPRAARPARPSRRPSLRVPARRHLAGRRRDRRHGPAASADRQTCRRVLPDPARADGPRRRPRLRDPPRQPLPSNSASASPGADAAPPSRSSGQSPRSAQSQPAAQPAASPDSAQGKPARFRFRPAQEFPAISQPAAPTPRQASARPSARPGGRTFPSGRPRRR